MITDHIHTISSQKLEIHTHMVAQAASIAVSSDVITGFLKKSLHANYVCVYVATV